MAGSLTDELQRRKAAPRAEEEELRGRIAELTDQLAQAEEQLPRLLITCRRSMRCSAGPTRTHQARDGPIVDL